MKSKLLVVIVALSTCLPVLPQTNQGSNQQTTAAAENAGKSKKKTGSKTTAPEGATAKCKDGTYSYSKHHQGTCSHHGGVVQWYK